MCFLVLDVNLHNSAAAIIDNKQAKSRQDGLPVIPSKKVNHKKVINKYALVVEPGNTDCVVNAASLTPTPNSIKPSATFYQSHSSQEFLTYEINRTHNVN